MRGGIDQLYRSPHVAVVIDAGLGDDEDWRVLPDSTFSELEGGHLARTSTGG
jgi:hypothetical protein